MARNVDDNIRGFVGRGLIMRRSFPREAFPRDDAQKYVSARVPLGIIGGNASRGKDRRVIRPQPFCKLILCVFLAGMILSFWFKTKNLERSNFL